MGIDLRLLPFYNQDMGNEDTSAFSHSIIDIERRRELWPKIEEIEKNFGHTVPKFFTSFCGRSKDWDDTCYGVTITTPYGLPLRYVYAKYLKSLKKHPAVKDNYKNRAAWAFIDKCPDDLKIALYWH